MTWLFINKSEEPEEVLKEVKEWWEGIKDKVDESDTVQLGLRVDIFDALAEKIE